MARKLMDAADLTAPLPAFRWLIWYQPDPQGGLVLVNGKAPEYLVGGTDDRAEADARVTSDRYTVRENPLWKTLN